MRTNQNRAAEFANIIDRYCTLTGLTHEDGLETILGDLLSDAMHWCDANGVDFEEAVNRGRFHYDNEVCEYCGETAEDMGICTACYEERNL